MDKAIPTKDRVALIKKTISIFNKMKKTGNYSIDFMTAANKAMPVPIQDLSPATIAIDLEKIEELRKPLGLSFLHLNGNFTDDVLAWLAFHDLATVKAESTNVFRKIHETRVPAEGKGWNYLYSLTEGHFNK